jgi:hypothetical protein
VEVRRVVLTLNISGVLQAIAESNKKSRRCSRSGTEVTDNWQPRLLRTRRKRPNCGTAEQSNELPPRLIDSLPRGKKCGHLGIT